MKITIGTKKGAEAVSGFLQKTSDLGKKTVSDVQAGAVALSEKAKQDSYLRRLKKYNPLFPDVYHSEVFHLPNMIMIRDDAERKGIDVCEGSIGWLGNESGMEVLYMYDEFVRDSGITFVPSNDCNAIYYVDKFDRRKYIRTDCIFQLAHDERIAELEYIAYSLGAKHCTIDIVETSKSSKKSDMHMADTANAVITNENSTINGDASTNFNSNYEATRQSEFKRCNESFWAGSDKPKRPKLKWFAYDDGIKGLIEMRCKGGNSVQTKSLKILGSNSTTMSVDTAFRIDAAIKSIGTTEGKFGVLSNSGFKKQVTQETKHSFIFNIEF